MKLWSDFKYALRLLKKTPGFSFLCLAVVALGLAISLYTFTLVYEVTSRPPPFPNGEHFAVVKLYSSDTNYQLTTSNQFTYNVLNQQNRSFDELGLLKTEAAVFTDGELTQEYFAGLVTPNILGMTKKAPFLGRTLTDDDTVQGAPKVALLGYDLWKSYFTANPGVVGQQTRINGETVTIVGVMPEGFQIALPHELWLPLSVSPSAPLESPLAYRIIGLIKSTLTFEQASADINRVFANLAVQYPEYYRDQYLGSRPIGLIDSGDPGGLQIIYIVCLLVMFLTAINLSSLFFVRANSRQRELAVRSAVGANRWEIVKQILLESFLLCFVGTLLALVLADLVLRATELDSPINTMGQSWRELWIHTNGLLVALGLMLSVWLLSMAATIFRLTRQDIVTALEGNGQMSSSRMLNWLTRSIISFEVIMSFFMLIVCGSLVFVIAGAYQSDYGVNSENVFTGSIKLRGEDYQTDSERKLFTDNLQGQLIQHPDIMDVSIATAVPGSGVSSRNILLEDIEATANDRLPSHGVLWIADNYFEMLEVSLVKGRFFNAIDNAESSPVAIVNEPFAQRYWPNQSPLGKRLQIDPSTDSEWITIVGVSQTVSQGPPIQPFINLPLLYRPTSQSQPGDFAVLLKSTNTMTTSDIATILQKSVANIDRNVAVTSIYSLDYVQDAGMTATGAIGKLFSYIALSVLGLSIIGIYGIISRSILLRSSEIGIRRAMGSSIENVIAIFLKQGCRYLGIGIIFGASAGMLTINGLARLSPDVLNYALASFGIVLVTLSALVLLASYIPTKIILKKEPGDALRQN